MQNILVISCKILQDVFHAKSYSYFMHNITVILCKILQLFHAKYYSYFMQNITVILCKNINVISCKISFISCKILVISCKKLQLFCTQITGTIIACYTTKSYYGIHQQFYKRKSMTEINKLTIRSKF